ncbi:MAG: 5-oxoprolinase subunit PxpB [Candidatus Bathyarchaeia archaeon]
MFSSPKYAPMGDRALLVKFGDSIDPNINRKVHMLNRAIEQTKIVGVEECVPAYTSLLVCYNPLKISYECLVYQLKDLEPNLDEFDTSTEVRQVVVPTVYGDEFGPDLADVAKLHNLTIEEVIRIHSETEYTVYMIGFIEGFSYMGKVPDSIATPRLETPRLKIPAGSVGIAGNQTGIYPCESPGGWRIIGRTPLKLFNPYAQQPTLFQPGDKVRFKPITKAEFEALLKK